VSSKSRMAESSSSDLLHTLYECGYLMRTARSRRFYPTARLFALAQALAQKAQEGDHRSRSGLASWAQLAPVTEPSCSCRTLAPSTARMVSGLWVAMTTVVP